MNPRSLHRNQHGQFASIEEYRSKRSTAVYVCAYTSLTAIIAFCIWWFGTGAYKAPEPKFDFKNAIVVDGTHVELIHGAYQARITYYGWTGNRMANGKYPKQGYVATSDRKIPLGTVVKIEGKNYVVGDYTAEWVHAKFEYPTFDIYSSLGDAELMKKGTHTTSVSIVENAQNVIE